MNKKIIIKSLISIIILLSVIILYGCTIGGSIGIIQFVVLLLISFLLLIFILSKSFFEKSFFSLLFICVITSAIFSGCYYWINNTFDNSMPSLEYQIVISDLPTGRSLDDGFFYYDNDGNEIYYSEFRVTPFDFNIGDQINVKEFDGVFGVKHFQFNKIN